MSALRPLVIGITGASLLACSVGNPMEARPTWFVTITPTDGDCPTAAEMGSRVWIGLDLHEDDGDEGIQLNYDLGESAPWLNCYETDEGLQCPDFGWEVDGQVLHHELVVERTSDGVLEGELFVTGTCGSACAADSEWVTCASTSTFHAERVIDEQVKTLTKEDECAGWGTPSAAERGEAVKVYVWNNNSNDHQLVWWDSAGTQTTLAAMPPGTAMIIDTWVGESFGVDDPVSGACRLVFQVEGPDEVYALDGMQR